MDSRDELIDELRQIVAQQAAQLEQQATWLREQADRIARLELELFKAKKDSSTSSKPPSSDMLGARRSRSQKAAFVLGRVCWRRSVGSSRWVTAWSMAASRRALEVSRVNSIMNACGPRSPPARSRIATSSCSWRNQSPRVCRGAKRLHCSAPCLPSPPGDRAAFNMLFYRNLRSWVRVKLSQFANGRAVGPGCASHSDAQADGLGYANWRAFGPKTQIHNSLKTNNLKAARSPGSRGRGETEVRSVDGSRFAWWVVPTIDRLRHSSCPSRGAMELARSRAPERLDRLIWGGRNRSEQRGIGGKKRVAFARSTHSPQQRTLCLPSPPASFLLGERGLGVRGQIRCSKDSAMLMRRSRRTRRSSRDPDAIAFARDAW